MAGNSIHLGEVYVDVHASLDNYKREIADLQRQTDNALNSGSRAAAQNARAASTAAASPQVSAAQAIARGVTSHVVGAALVSRLVLGQSPLKLLTGKGVIGNVIRLNRELHKLGDSAQSSQRVAIAIAHIKDQGHAADRAIARLAATTNGIPVVSGIVQRLEQGRATAGGRIALLARNLPRAARGMRALAKGGLMVGAAFAVVASAGYVLDFFRALPKALEATVKWLKTPWDFAPIIRGLKSVSESIGGQLLKIPGWGRGAMHTVSSFSTLFGGPDFEKQIDAAEQGTKKIAVHMAAAAATARIFALAIGNARSAVSQLNRQGLGMLYGMFNPRKGIEADTHFQIKDVNSTYDQAIHDAKVNLAAFAQKYDGSPGRLGDIARSAIRNGAAKAIAQLKELRDKQIEYIKSIGKLKLDQYDKELRAQKNASDEQAKVLKLVAAGKSFDAQRESAGALLRPQISNAMQHGQLDLAASLQKQLAAQIAVIDKAQADDKAAAERDRLQRRGDLKSQIKQLTLEESGQAMQALIEGIKHDIANRVAAHPENEKLLNQLGALQIAQLKQTQQHPMMAEYFKQISFSRFGAGGGPNEQLKLAKDQLKIQKGILKNTDPHNRMVAVAG